MASSIARTATLFRKLLGGRRITYRDIEREENVNRRTALRWIAEARRVFADGLREGTRNSGEKEFWLDATGNNWFRGFKYQPPTAAEMAALDAGVQALARERAPHERDRLIALRSKLHGALEAFARACRTDTDVQAITDAFGTASRPGPHVPVDEEVTAPLREALLKQRKVAFRYHDKEAQETRRRVRPLGLAF